MRTVGRVTERVAELLQLQIPGDSTIYFGPGNLEHMRTRHPDDYAKYGADLEAILAAPDYVGQNPSDGSIEYVKEYQIGTEYVKVAVRLSLRGERYYARTLYRLNEKRVRNFIEKGTLKKV